MSECKYACCPAEPRVRDIQREQSCGGQNYLIDRMLCTNVCTYVLVYVCLYVYVCMYVYDPLFYLCTYVLFACACFLA